MTLPIRQSELNAVGFTGYFPALDYRQRKEVALVGSFAGLNPPEGASPKGVSGVTTRLNPRVEVTPRPPAPIS